MEIGIIYMATNLINGKKYIGLTTSGIEFRKSQHKSDSLNARKTIFHNAINKYGWDNFSWQVIEGASSLEELYQKEKKWIAYNRTWIGYENCNGYNMTMGGEGTHGVGIISIDTVIAVKELLRDTTYRYKEIGGILEVEPTIVKDIYQGKSWNHVHVNGFYPKMERDIGYFIEKSVIKQIKIKLMQNETSKRTIAMEFNVSESLVSAIETGLLHNDVFVEGFTEKMDLIKRKCEKQRLNLIKKIMELLMQGYSKTDISSLTDTSIYFINSIINNHDNEEIHVKGFKEWCKNNPMNRQDDDLPEVTVKNIKLDLVFGLEPVVIASKYNISLVRVYNIRKGGSYSDIHVEGFKPFKNETDWYIGENNPTAILTNEKVYLIRALAKRKNCNQKQLSKYFNVSATNINEIIKRRIWTHLEDVKFEIAYLISIEKQINSNFPNKHNKLNNDDVIAIKKALFLSDEPMGGIANRFNISGKHVADINNKKYYSDIKLPNEPNGSYRDRSRTKNKSQTSNAKLSESKIVEIRQNLMNGVTSLAIRKKYNISESTIISIKFLRSWAWVQVEGYSEWLRQQ